VIGVSHRAVRELATPGGQREARLPLTSVEQLRSKRRAAGKNPRG
jgi:hypothetical protein